MILTLILSAAAGWAARPAEPKITDFLISLVGEENLPAGPDRRVATVLACLFGAAILIQLGEGEVSTVVFAIGAILGYFQQQIREAILNRQA